MRPQITFGRYFLAACMPHIENGTKTVTPVRSGFAVVPDSEFEQISRRWSPELPLR